MWYMIFVLLQRREYFHIENKLRQVNKTQKKSKYSAACKGTYYKSETQLKVKWIANDINIRFSLIIKYNGKR